MSELTITNKPLQVTDNGPKLDQTGIGRIEQKVGNQSVDEFVPREKKGASNDGKFSWGQAIKNLGKGLISPVTAMFSSVKGFLLGAGMMIGGAALVAATGGIILPVFIAMGIAFGAYEGIKGTYKIATAKNGDDVEKACLDIGTAVTSLVPSIFGARFALIKMRVAIQDMTSLQTFVNLFKEVPRSIRTTYRIFSGECARMRIKLAQRKQIKPIVDTIYDEEIKKLAKSLGVSENELKQIMPRRAGYIFFIGKSFDGYNLHLMKPRVKINPSIIEEGFFADKYGHTVRERIAGVISHEVRHSYQRILPINQLTLKEHLAIIDNVVSSIEKSNPKFKQGLAICLVNKTNAILRHLSISGKRIKKLSIPKSKEMELEAKRLVQDEVECLKANIDMKTQIRMDSYLTASFEVDARQYSLLRRSEMLISDVNRGDDPKNWVQRFRQLRDDFSCEISNFEKPARIEFTKGSEAIKLRLEQVKQKLLARNIKQEDLNKSYEGYEDMPVVRQATREESLKAFPELALQELAST